MRVVDCKYPLEVLYKADGYDVYLWHILPESSKACIYFAAYEVTAWASDKGDPYEIDSLLEGSIDWDGDADLHFKETHTIPGYVNLCGSGDFLNFGNMMPELYKKCKQRLEQFKEAGK